MNSRSKTPLPTVAVVLAAGQGTRMRSQEPKVLHRAAGRPLLEWVIAAARTAGCRKLLLVVGHQAERVRASFSGQDLGVEIGWVEQREQKGTGDALARAVARLEAPARLLVLSGDVPLVRGETLEALLEAAGAGWALAVADLDAPGSLGRVVADANGRLSRIVEAADATAEELEIRSVNAGIYVAPSAEITPRLARLEPANAQGELYLTDAFTGAAADATPVELFTLAEASEALGVNDRSDLARVHRHLLNRKCERLMTDGVTVLEPERTVIEDPVEIGRDSVIHPGVTLAGYTRIGAGSTVHDNSWIRDSNLGDGVEIGPLTVIEEAEIGASSRIGPFARLRPGARIGAGSRIGNFVEIKKSVVEKGAKVNHLTYVGDARVGAGANVGAGTITCNYDGFNKAHTDIGKGAFIGSNTALVAPVKIGDGAIIGAGSVVTQDVAADSIGVTRSQQKEITGGAVRFRKKAAAEKARAAKKSVKSAKKKA